MVIAEQDLHSFLEEKHDTYNNSDFISNDPISIPHRFSQKEDIELSAFLIATIAWGRRDTIINNGHRLMKLMGDSPYDFVRSWKSDAKSRRKMDGFKHRTFNETDLCSFMDCLNHIHLNHNSLQALFVGLIKDSEGNIQEAISGFKKVFFSVPHTGRTTKHISDPVKGSAAKRINMFLRWMVRKDKRGVDFGIWDTISPSLLHMPLDVHTSRVARKLGLLNRKQDDWRAVAELTNTLRKFDSNDPVKYDFALFGLGIEEKF